MKHFLSDFDLSKQELHGVLQLASEIKSGKERYCDALKGKLLGLIFQKHSTRTKASFEAAMYQLGGHSILLDSSTSQMARGESPAETAKILSAYTDVIAARLYKQTDLEEMARASRVPIINALTDLFHPCQILADLLTIREKKGVKSSQGSLEGLKLAYFGDGGNNVAHSLLINCSKAGLDVAIACPPQEKYSPDSSLLAKARESAVGKIEVTSDCAAAAADADVLYTDTWISMGMEAEKQERVRNFMPFQVNASVVAKAKKDCIVMHCLPAYVDYEITKDVLYGGHSVIYDQAENRMHAQKALLVWLLKQ